MPAGCGKGETRETVAELRRFRWKTPFSECTFIDKCLGEYSSGENGSPMVEWYGIGNRE